MQESQLVGLLVLAGGIFAIAASACDWDFFMNSRKAKAWVKRIGRNNARWMYGGIGGFVCLMGLFLIIKAPGDDAGEAQAENNPPAVFPPMGAAGGGENKPADQSVAANPSQPALGYGAPYSSTPPASRPDPAPTKAVAQPQQNFPSTLKTPEPAATTTTSPAPKSTPIDLPENGVDLLPLIDPARDQLHAKWSKENGNLLSPVARPALLQVPIELPANYTVTAVVEELTGNGSFGLGVKVAGSGVSIVIAGTKGDTSGLQLVDNKITRVNSTNRRGPVLKPGQNRIVCTVNQNRLTVQCNGETIIDWDDDPSRLSYGYEAKDGHKDQLQIGSWQTSYRITQLTLVPLEN